MRYAATFPAVRTSPVGARRFASDVLADVSGEVAESIALIVSELATNSLRHAASAFEIRIDKRSDRIRIEVEDDGAGDPVVMDPGPSDTSGRGLQIVEALAEEWGVTAKPESTGKTVWAVLVLPPANDEVSARQSDGADIVSGQRHARRRATGSSGAHVDVQTWRVMDTTWPTPFLRATVRDIRTGKRRHHACPPPVRRRVATPF